MIFVLLLYDNNYSYGSNYHDLHIIMFRSKHEVSQLCFKMENVIITKFSIHLILMSYQL